jgi:hypothetical protein
MIVSVGFFKLIIFDFHIKYRIIERRIFMGLSKSAFIETMTCSKKGWLSKYHPELAQVSKSAEGLMSAGHEIGDTAKKLFGDYVEVQYQEDKSLMIFETKKLIKEGNRIIAEAAFAMNGCYCQADLFTINKDGSVNIYEVKGSTRVKDYHINDMAFQYNVIKKCGYNINAIFNIHINSNYLRGETLNLNELFNIEDCTEEVIKRQPIIEDAIKNVKKVLVEDKEPTCCIGMKCKDPHECQYFKYCTRHLPENNVFTVAGLSFKNMMELYETGIITFNDILSRKPKMNDKKYRQIESSALNLKPIIKRDEINKFLDGLKMPLYFLDFETFQQVVPKWEDVKPYSQIVFQYSLHYLKRKGGKLWHKEFLAPAGVDPRYAVAKQLCEDIPMNVTVLAYNMSFEKTVIKGLAELYPEFYTHLMNIRDNIQDLMLPFSNQWYYDSNFNGSYSIKVVLPTLYPDVPELNYHNLDENVQNGAMAMEAYASMASMTDKNEIEKIRTALLNYCELDTFAMVKIWEFLKNIVKSRS